MTAVAWNANLLEGDLDEGTIEFRGKWINSPYLVGGQVAWGPIVNEFHAEGSSFVFGASPWRLVCPELATGEFQLINEQCYDVHGKSPIIRGAQEIHLTHPDALPVAGRIDPAAPYHTLYENAMGDGVDLRVGQWQARAPRAEHLFVIRQEPPGGGQSVNLDAEVALPNSQVPNFSGSYDISAGISLRLQNGPDKAGITIRPAVAWYYDAANELVVTPIQALLVKTGQTIAIRKVVPRSLIQTAIAERPNGELRVDATSTFYPDAHAESTSVDGYAAEILNTTTWANVRDGVGTTAADSATTDEVALLRSGTSSPYWDAIYRGVFLFDTSALSGMIVSSATMSLYGYATQQQSSGWSLGVNIYSSLPASNTAVVAGDYDSLGATAFCDSAIALGSWNTSGYNAFALNANGIAAIDVEAITKLGTRDPNYDVADSPPTWENNKEDFIQAYFADQTGTDKDPKLDVTYAAAAGGVAPQVHLQKMAGGM